MIFEDDYPTGHVGLAREVTAAGLIVTELMPLRRWPDNYKIQFWTPDGTLWAEGSGENTDSVRRHIKTWERWKAGERW